MRPFSSFRKSSAGIPETIAGLNTQVEQCVVSNLIHERMLERWWAEARKRKKYGPGYWLLLVRLAEATLLCAGNYADNCEFEAAGDLLVNPREILVRERQSRRAVVKNRHGRLSTQFGLGGSREQKAMKRFSAGVTLEITKPPLLPHMTQVLVESRRVSSFYLDRLETGRRRIADALAFLAAWPVSNPLELRQRLEASTPREKKFVESRLCRFDLQVFRQIGTDLQQSLERPEFRSAFLAEPRIPYPDQQRKQIRRTPLPAQAV